MSSVDELTGSNDVGCRAQMLMVWSHEQFSTSVVISMNVMCTHGYLDNNHLHRKGLDVLLWKIYNFCKSKFHL